MIWTYQPVKNPEARRLWLILGVVFLIVGNLIAAIRFQNDFSRFTFSAATFSLAVIFFTFLMLRKPRYYYIEDDVVYSASRRTEISDVEDIVVDREKMVIKLKLRDSSFLSLKKLYFDGVEDLEKVEAELRRCMERLKSKE
jgi:hypothetical protein